jgi:hypothetical protein
MKMADWLRLKAIPTAPLPTTVCPPAGSSGVLFDVVVSPYDLPEAVRGFRKSNGRFRIEFRYIDGDEPIAEELRVDEHVSAFEGKHSGRLLALEVDTAAIGADAVGVAISTPVPQNELVRRNIDEAWKRVAARHTKPDEKRVFDSARAALRTRENDLVSQLVGS